MLPDYELSTIPIKSTLVGGKGLPHSITVTHTSGPIAIQDPSEGINYQVWSGVANVSEGIFIWADNSPITKYIALSNITEFSFTFDQSGNLCITYIRYGSMYLWWYDSTVSSMVTTSFGTGYISPKVELDDRRIKAINISDIILGYVRDGNLYTRIQRDRYEIEYLLKTDVDGYIDSMGMGKNWRFQFHIIHT